MSNDSNNILEIDGMPHYQTVGVIGSYCRFDRQIVITVSYPDSEEYNDMSCVLNDNESRELYRIKEKENKLNRELPTTSHSSKSSLY